LTQRRGQHRIAAQLVVVIEVFIAQRQPQDALHDEIQQRVLNLIGLAVIGEAGGEAAHDCGALLQFLQNQHSAVGGDVAPIEAPNQLPSSQFLRCRQRLREGVESSRSLDQCNDQSHAKQDVSGEAQVTGVSKNVCYSAVYI